MSPGQPDIRPLGGRAGRTQPDRPRGDAKQVSMQPENPPSQAADSP